MFWLIRHGVSYSERNTKIYQGFGVHPAKLSERGAAQIRKTSEVERPSSADMILRSPYGKGGADGGNSVKKAGNQNNHRSGHPRMSVQPELHLRKRRRQQGRYGLHGQPWSTGSPKLGGCAVYEKADDPRIEKIIPFTLCVDKRFQNFLIVKMTEWTVARYQ
ncbi:MAG: hypothetical protein OSJ58_12390 [Dysosmobacter sp.]|nr:hypothetical protein [Dysosmobacter sp.]